jgi:hypothetical protein
MPDLRVYLPHLDLAIPIWPWPTTLAPEFAPAEYNPRRVFFDEMLPALQQRREQTGMLITSYHVGSGKADELLPFNRAFPALMVGLGMTGIGHWAYNVPYGSTWDDCDGQSSGPDYSFVYDGAEAHPLNQQFNPAREVVVPSIRWEAVRGGMEDGRLLLHLRALQEEGKLPSALGQRVREMLATAAGMADGTQELTGTAYEQFAQNLRLLYVESSLRYGCCIWIR